eukprot:TRINITY_DN55945_c0_g1_i1.p1 TRINITY_DN55945_c0_g1~~TRINITY_DN55945_c0_g1_i1.p1  ORF type:complete len:120 (+),score=32.97 TRINITY_DN55945_c0_g1_i1:2-361(+)
MATATGWGVTQEGGQKAQYLREVRVKTMKNAECGRSYGPGSITTSMLCAAEDGKDACQGDSGGPLVVREGNKKYVQIGLVSWGAGCARREYPGVYTRITKVHSWIMKIASKKGKFCLEE